MFIYILALKQIINPFALIDINVCQIYFWAVHVKANIPMFPKWYENWTRHPKMASNRLIINSGQLQLDLACLSWCYNIAIGAVL